MEHEYDITKFMKNNLGLAKEDIGCFVSRIDNPGRIWNSENVLEYYLVVLVKQILAVALTNRITFWILRPLHQPQFVAELLVSAWFSLITYLNLENNLFVYSMCICFREPFGPPCLVFKSRFRQPFP